MERGDSSGEYSPNNRESYNSQMDDSSYRLQLLESKMLRKKAEEDAQLLANRIALLQMEEKRAVKKIEETKKKAKEILDLKTRNLQAQQEKEQLRRQKEEDELRKLEQNKNIKEKIKANQESSRSQMMRKLKEDVDNMRRTKQENKEMNEYNKDDDYYRNAQRVQQIRGQQKEAQLRKQKTMEEAKQKARLEYEGKVEQELLAKQQTDELIAKLEKQEMELIQRLQNTQNLQKEAFDYLEEALSSSPSLKKK